MSTTQEVMVVQRPEIVIAQRDLDMYREHFCAEAPENEWKLFVQKCCLLGLNPMLNEVYLVGRNNKTKNGWVKKFATQVSITGLISLAERTGRYEGHTAPEYYDEDLKSYPVWPLSKGPYPYAIRIGVYKKGWREASYAIIYFHERAQYFNKDTGELTAQWKAQGIHMHLKCALAAALRWAFQETCGGVYIHEEMGTADQEAQGDITIIPPVTVESAPEGLKTTVQTSQERSASQVPTPAQRQQESKPPTLRDRFGSIYKRALALQQFHFNEGATDQEKIQAFLDFAGSVIDAKIASAGQLTHSRFDTIEAYLSAKDAALLAPGVY